MEKLIILGSGIAGLTAAIYAARASLEPLVLTGKEDGGQLMLTTDVENFPGFPDSILGPDLVANTKKQAQKFGTRFKSFPAESIVVKDKNIIVKTKDGEVETVTLIIATGATARWLNLPTEKQFQSKGVHTCATCDGYFYKDKEVFVVGGGDSACEESSFLANHAKKVTMLVRTDAMRASKIMQDRVEKNPKIDIMKNSGIVEYKGDVMLKSVMIKDSVSGEVKEYPIDGVFLAIGHIPNTKMVEGLVDLDEHGFVKTDQKLHTNVPGILAAGDVQDPIYKQAIVAAGTGCQATLEAERYYETWKASQ